MLRSLWRSFDRFSLQYFKYVINELQGIEVVDTSNTEVVVDILQSIVEIVTYGDRHDPSIFECFMEYQVLAEFVRMLKISRNTRIQAKVLQYLSIMIQNLHSDHAIYYCFSNGHINSIITHEYGFHAGDLALYYVSFLRAVSSKLNKDTICLLLKVQEGVVTSFLLYTEALRFAHHGEKMIQTAIRSLTLSIYSVSDDMVCQFLMAPPVSQYFSDLVLKLREECVHLDMAISNMGKYYSSDKRKELKSGIDKFLDDLYYIKDLLCLGNSHLSTLVTHKLLGLLVVPILIPMQLGKNTAIKISACTSLYLLSRLLQVVDKKEILDSVASLILYPHVVLGPVLVTEDCAVDNSQVKLSAVHGNNTKEAFGLVLEPKLLAHHLLSSRRDCVQERVGILSYMSSDDQGLLLASLMLLLILAESNDLDNLWASAFGFRQKEAETDDAVDSKLLEEITCLGCMPQILNALLNNLGSYTSSSMLTQWHAAWLLIKIIDLQRSMLTHHELHLFNISVRLNTSFHQAREHLLNELNECWFDYMLDTFEKEWISCKKALEESPRNKDPSFVLEIAFYKQPSDETSIGAWQRMVDAVKIFVLHLQLKAYVLNGCIPITPPLNSRTGSLSSPRSFHASDPLNANFGTEVMLGSGIPCKIAFSKVGIRDIYMLPVAKGASGKLLLLEKHPFRSQTGTVLAVARLAGLTPKVDEERGTWLHLCIREFNPALLGKNCNSKSLIHETDARWTLGFSDAEACEAASLLIAEETCKQRSFIESLLAPCLYDNHVGGEVDRQILLASFAIPSVKILKAPHQFIILIYCLNWKRKAPNNGDCFYLNLCLWKMPITGTS
ncbi:protein TRANSPARENT TESTA 9 isoform X3 [Beta vulgaris subsp. vulgaris]|uniref:protein TRANSPARENT TESTA 9 isoform X3 n=1 Tax=Beta vulgaris subsp. vulgaris TaxID=3555 RepID=UPI0020370E54|nr:protein TRANSPARENT TESTA 9 isoform X3 [Beta vulgaris subsp. vulgaris]